MEQRESDRTQARQEAARLSADGVRGVALTWVDNAGLTRVKAVPVARLPHATRWGVGMSPVFDVFAVDDSATTSRHLGGPDGDLRLFPDLDALTVLSAQPGWAWAPVERYDQKDLPHPVCQRQFARRMTERAAARGLRIQMGFETEWVAIRGDDHLDYPSTGPAYGMTRVVELSDYLREILEALTAQNVEVFQLHPEYAPGQFEVSTAPADPVRAADLSVLVRETVRAVSVNHGMRASFAPVVEAYRVGNGAHLHVSPTRDGVNLLRGGSGAQGMTEEGESFVAGVLDALPALLAIGAPSPASFLRLVPSHWAGSYHCWGVENREAALRFITGSPGEESAANAEIKCFDAAANPYLAVGAVIAAGLAGIDDGRTLPDPVAGDPALFPPGISRPPRLPTTLPQVLDHFSESALLREALGDPLFEAILAVRHADHELFDGRSPEEIAAATRWRY